MYYYLMGALKRKVLRELKDCFTYYFPQHQDIVPNIGHKYSFKQRPQKGIVVTSANATPLRLSADNFQGTVISHVMLAGLSNQMGLAIEWITEDQVLIQENNGVFPTPAGIYYVEMFSRERLERTLTPQEYQDTIDTQGRHPFYFFVDPLLTSTREVLNFDAIPGKATVNHAPFLGGSFRLLADGAYLEKGRSFVLQASQSLEVLSPLDPEVDLGLPIGKISPSAVSGPGPFEVVALHNDVLEFELDGLTVSVTLPPGSQTSDTLAQALRNGMYAGGIAVQDLDVQVVDGRVRLTAPTSLIFKEDLLSTANRLLGFVPGYVSPRLEGYLFPSYAVKPTTIPLIVNGVRVDFPIYRGHIDPERMAARMQDSFGSGELSVEVISSGDYTFDAQTGEIFITHTVSPGTVLEADYNYPSASKGPFAIHSDSSNNTAIPGVVLAFGKQLRDEDKQAVVVHSSRVQCASEYGGRWEITIDMDIITRDPMAREEISDLLLMYFFAVRKESLTDEGLEILDVSFGGEVEETYDDTANDYYFNASISLTFQTDWSIHVPKPLTIERIVPSSFRERATASAQDRAPSSDLMRPVTPEDLNLKTMGKMHIRGKNSNFESIG